MRAVDFKFRSTFDAKKILDRMDKKVGRVLLRSGAFAQKSIKRSIRKAGKAGKARSKREKAFFDDQGNLRSSITGRFIKTSGISRPGQPPRSHTGGLRNNIRFSIDKKNESVVVGAQRFASKGNAKDIKPKTVPAVLEFGGSRKTRRIIRGKSRSITYRHKPRPFVGPKTKLAAEKFAESMKRERL